MILKKCLTCSLKIHQMAPLHFTIHRLDQVTCVGTAAFVTPCTACHQQGRTVKLKRIKTNWSQFCVNKDQMDRF